MQVLGWLAFPIAATLAAIVWVLWVSRPRPPADMRETLQDFRRFTSALEGAAGCSRRGHEQGRSQRAGAHPEPAPGRAPASYADQAIPPQTAAADRRDSVRDAMPDASPDAMPDASPDASPDARPDARPRRSVAPVDHGPVRQHGALHLHGAVRGRDAADA